MAGIRRYPYVLLDVFTHNALEGNQLAVFTDARGLSDAEMQDLAKETNLSETTFIVPARSGNGARTRRAGAHLHGAGGACPLPAIQRWELPGICASNGVETRWLWR